MSKVYQAINTYTQWSASNDCFVKIECYSFNLKLPSIFEGLLFNTVV